MKKIIVLLVFAVFCFGFTDIEKANTQPPIPAYWAFTIYWDTTNCDCDKIIAKLLTYEVYNTEDSCYVDYGTNVSVTGTQYTNSGTDDCMVVDCGDCYRVTATINYYDNSGLCCSGTNNTTWSGTELNNGTAQLTIDMN